MLKHGMDCLRGRETGGDWDPLTEACPGAGPSVKSDFVCACVFVSYHPTAAHRGAPHLGHHNSIEKKAKAK